VTVRRHLAFALVLTAAVAIPRAYLVSRAQNESSDDDYHLVRGLEFLRRDPGLAHRELNDPPLGEGIAALPLWVLGGTTHGPDEGTALYSQRNYGPDTATMLVALWKAFLFLPIAAVIFLWCARLYGPASAWLALIVILFDPAIAAHMHLASLDVLATGAILMACYAGWRCFERPSRGRIVLASLATAAALLTKHTAVLAPLILLGYALIPRWQQSGAQPKGEAKDLVVGVAFTLLLVWALLLFDVSPVQSKPVPGGVYVKSILDAARHANEPNDAYLLGRVRRGGWWYYFPVVAAHKIPIPTAILFGIALTSPWWRRPRREELSLLVPAALYTAFLFAQPIQIGWRHALPAYVPLIMLASRALGAQDSELGTKTPRPVPFLATGSWLLVTLLVLDTTRHHPDYISYSNRPIDRPYEIFSDSNLDWGQSLKQAARWIEANKDSIAGRPVYIRPFAAANRAVRHYVGDRAIPLRFGDRPPTGGLLIISPVCVSGVSESNDDYAFLRGVRPHDTVGRTLYVYDLDRLPK
jgi:hypothetical protein